MPADEQIEDWFSRLQTERMELIEKITALTNNPNKDALHILQLHTMIAYCAVLDIRINRELDARRENGTR